MVSLSLFKSSPGSLFSLFFIFFIHFLPVPAIIIFAHSPQFRLFMWFFCGGTWCEHSKAVLDFTSSQVSGAS